jgi:hypothetical protein
MSTPPRALPSLAAGVEAWTSTRSLASSREHQAHAAWPLRPVSSPARRRPPRPWCSARSTLPYLPPHQRPSPSLHRPRAVRARRGARRLPLGLRRRLLRRTPSGAERRRLRARPRLRARGAARPPGVRGRARRPAARLAHAPGERGRASEAACRSAPGYTGVPRDDRSSRRRRSPRCRRRGRRWRPASSPSVSAHRRAPRR